MDDEQYRTDVRRFIVEHAPSRPFVDGLRVPSDAGEERAIRDWLAALYASGHLGGGWPIEWGGDPAHRATHDLILMEELFRARAYRPLDQVIFAAQAILQFGTEAQKAEYLLGIRGGRHIWCQLFSEPDAGSDLASLRTRAVPDGDGWVVTGQKVWSTDAQWADMGLLLARTDPNVDRHAGLTAFVVPMSKSGIDVRPIREMTGSEEFCEVFLDDVRLGSEHVLGEVNGGWRVITTGLASERAFVGANAVQLAMMFADLVALAGACRLPDGSVLIEHEDVRLRLADLFTEVEGARLVVVDTVERILRDEEHATDGAVAKLVSTETYVQLCEAALELLGNTAGLDEGADELVERWYAAFLWSRAPTISGGASEILRGIVGRQLLGLPRS